MKEQRGNERLLLSTTQIIRRPRSRRSIFEFNPVSPSPESRLTNPELKLANLKLPPNHSQIQAPPSDVFIKSTTAYRLLEEQARVVVQQHQKELDLLRQLYQSKSDQVAQAEESLGQQKRQVMKVNQRIEQLQNQFQQEREINAELNNIAYYGEEGEEGEEEEGEGEGYQGQQEEEGEDQDEVDMMEDDSRTQNQLEY